jgi:KipI family sensor histidine kinase inhibitor
MNCRVLPCGERAVLAETSDLGAAVELHAALAGAALPGVEDLVPAARTVLIRFDPAITSGAQLTRSLAQLRPAPADAAQLGGAITIPVSYDGEDLEEVARLTGLTAAQVAARHASAEYTVAFCGFSPGFGYLTGGDPALAVPRRDNPRTKVPAGSVALAGEYTGVYPSDLPGGWQIIGHTSAVLWDLARTPPALFAPGVRVRFTAT